MTVHQSFTLRDLEGRPGFTTAYLVNSRTEALRMMRVGHIAVTAAGPHGAINIWRDRQQRLHAAFRRDLEYMDHTTVPTLTDLALWLKKWWPELRTKERQ